MPWSGLWSARSSLPFLTYPHIMAGLQAGAEVEAYMGQQQEEEQRHPPLSAPGGTGAPGVAASTQQVGQQQQCSLSHGVLVGVANSIPVCF